MKTIGYGCITWSEVIQVSWSLVAFCVTEVMTCHSWMRATWWNWQHQYQFNWHLNPYSIYVFLNKYFFFFCPRDNIPDCSSGIYWHAPSWHGMLKCSNTVKEFAFCINLKTHRSSLVKDNAKISLKEHKTNHISAKYLGGVKSLCQIGKQTGAQELKDCSTLERLLQEQQVLELFNLIQASIDLSKVFT